ncbi:ABC transporter permease [Bacillus sp. IITD106]|nr:ABC transporter permease [Bacillus sp. IITD106]
MALIILIVTFSLTSPDFLTTTNLLNITRQVSVIGLLSIAMTFVIVSGGIDLSVGSIVAVVSVISTGMMVEYGLSPIVAVLIGIIIGTLIGALNGILISTLNMSPFITTLGTMTLLRGVGYLYTGGYPIYGLPSSFSTLGQGYWGGIPVPTIILVLAIVMSVITLRKTRLGRHIYAIGGNEEAALHAGVRVKKIKFIVYMMSGLLCGIAALIASSRLGAGMPTLGVGYELQAIAAVIIGGAALTGGSGTITGTVIGALILGVLSNGLSLLSINSFVIEIISGIVIIIAVLIDQIRSRFTLHVEIEQAKQRMGESG